MAAKAEGARDCSPKGLIVLGLSLSLGRGRSFLADSGEPTDDEDLLRSAVVLCLICVLDDVL